MTKATYVDGFVLVVPKERLADYKKLAKEAAATWKKFGALSYRECKGAHLTPPAGGPKMLTFTKLMNPKKGDTVWFSYIEYKSKAHRDAVNKKVMAHFEKKYTDINMPEWMMKMKMAMGGFTIEVQ